VAAKAAEAEQLILLFSSRATLATMLLHRTLLACTLAGQPQHQQQAVHRSCEAQAQRQQHEHQCQPLHWLLLCLSLAVLVLLVLLICVIVYKVHTASSDKRYVCVLASASSSRRSYRCGGVRMLQHSKRYSVCENNKMLCCSCASCTPAMMLCIMRTGMQCVQRL
jgi:hypothetical protein